MGEVLYHGTVNIPRMTTGLAATLAAMTAGEKLLYVEGSIYWTYDDNKWFMFANAGWSSL